MKEAASLDPSLCKHAISLLILLLLVILIPQKASGQNTLFEDANVLKSSLSDPTTKHLTKIEQRRVTGEVIVKRLSTSPDQVLTSEGKVQLDMFPGKSFVARTKTFESRGDGFTWTGDLENETGYAVLVVEQEAGLSSRVTGVVRTNKELYRIEPLDESPDLHAVIHVDPSTFIWKDDTPSEQDTSDKGEASSGSEQSGVGYKFSQDNSGADNTQMASTTPIRVLTVYTQAAKSAHSNIVPLIQTAIAEANTALRNSGIFLLNGGPSSYKFTDRYRTLISYNENASTTTYRQHVVNLKQGNVSNVHALRNTYGADVVVMVVADDNPSGVGGEAYAINADASGAFAVVNDDYLTGDNVFDHEIGHLIGGKHQNDGRSSPGKPYSHGHITPSGRATVMVQSGPSPRIPYWSDPGRTFQGEVLGTSSYADMERMFKERGSTVAAFRSDPPLSVVISGPGYVPQGQSATWYANATGGGLSFLCYKWYTRPVWSSTWTLDESTCSRNSFYKRITDPIYMYVVASDEFQTATSPLWYVTYSGAARIAAGTAPSDELQAVSYSLGQNYPNPFNPATEIRFSLPEATHVSLAVYDVMGRRVAQLLDETRETGVHRVTWNATGLPSGTYFYQIKAGAFAQSKHMVLMK